jgi:hypothetical protein
MIMTRNTLMRNALLATTIALLASPVMAQDDPFAAIVDSPDGASTRLNDVSLPMRQPTKDELRQYLEAFHTVDVAAAFTIDDRTGSHSARFGVPSGHAEVGPIQTKNGTRLEVKAGFEKRPGEREAVMRSLLIKPTNSVRSVGFLGMRFHKLHMDSKGLIHVKLNLRAMGIDFLPTDLVIEKIHKDSKGNMIFETEGHWIPDVMITPNGDVKRESFFLHRWIAFKDLKGNKLKIPPTVKLTDWPPKASDLLAYLPEEGEESASLAESVATLKPVLKSIPITDLNLKFSADADPRRIKLSNDEGYIDLDEHTLRYEANGSFAGRTYTSNPNKPNTYSATASLSGKVKREGLGSATIDRVDVALTGEHSGTIPFEDLDAINVEGTLNADIDGEFSDVVVGLPGGPTVAANGRSTVNFDGDGKLILRPFSSDPADKKELIISKDSRYSFRTEGDVELSNLGSLAPEGVTLPDSMTLEPKNGEPVFSGEGDLGTKMGFAFARPTFEVRGTVKRGAVLALEGGEISTTLKPGATVEVDGMAFAGIKTDTFEGGGVRLTADAKLSGTGTNTSINSNGVSAEFPGEADVDVRLATNVRRGTRNGDETIVRSLGVNGKATLRTGEGEVTMGLPGQPKLSGTVAPGTSVEFDTGVLRRKDNTGTVLETEGFKDGKRGATVNAHLVLTAGSIAHRDLALAFAGRTVVDLNAALGFRMDPMNPQTGAELRDAKLGLTVQFPQGGDLTFKQGASTSATVKLDGSTKISLSTVVALKADGSPELRSLDNVNIQITANAVDLKTILQPLGSAVISIGSRSTVQIKNATVKFLEKGMRITHKGISVEIAPGVIEIGTR